MSRYLKQRTSLFYVYERTLKKPTYLRFLADEENRVVNRSDDPFIDGRSFPLDCRVRRFRYLIHFLLQTVTYEFFAK